MTACSEAYTCTLLQVAEGLFPHFPLQFNYMNIQVQDVPSEDMVIHFPKCFDFIDNAIARGGAQPAGTACMVQHVPAASRGHHLLEQSNSSRSRSAATTAASPGVRQQQQEE